MNAFFHTIFMETVTLSAATGGHKSPVQQRHEETLPAVNTFVVACVHQSVAVEGCAGNEPTVRGDESKRERSLDNAQNEPSQRLCTP